MALGPTGAPQDDAEPLRIRVAAWGRLRQDSDLLVDQIRTIDNRRLVQGLLTRLSSALMAKTEHAIHEVLDLPDS